MLTFVLQEGLVGTSVFKLSSSVSLPENCNSLINYSFHGCHLKLQRNNHSPAAFSILFQVWFILFCGLLVSGGSIAEIAKLLTF